MEVDHRMPGCSSSPDTAELVKALCLAQQKYAPIKKSGLMESREGGYRYSTWADIVEAMYPALHANGLVFIPLQGWVEDRLVMCGQLRHGPSGQWISSTCPVRDVPEGSAVRGDSQSFEIATTYAKKTLLKAMGGGWEEGDEKQDQDKAKVQVERTEEEVALVGKIKTQLEIVKADRVKLERIFAKIEKAVEEGRVSRADADKFSSDYPLPPKPEQYSTVDIATVEGMVEKLEEMGFKGVETKAKPKKPLAKATTEETV